MVTECCGKKINSLALMHSSPLKSHQSNHHLGGDGEKEEMEDEEEGWMGDGKEGWMSDGKEGWMSDGEKEWMEDEEEWIMMEECI